MTQDKVKADPQTQPNDELDVEGHSMIINPTIARDMARVRTNDLEREAREHARAKEAKR